MNLIIASFASIVLATYSHEMTLPLESEISSEISAETTTIKAEIIESISIKSLWHSVDPFSYTSPMGAFIGYWATDVESMPMDGDWLSLGVVMGGIGDLYEKPVAVRIWTKVDDIFLKQQSLKETESSDNAVALFGSKDGTIKLRFVITPVGEVFVNDELIGVVEY